MTDNTATNTAAELNNKPAAKPAPAKQGRTWFLKIPTEMVSRRMSGLQSLPGWTSILGIYLQLLLWSAPYEGWVPYYGDMNEAPEEEAARSLFIPSDDWARAIRYLVAHQLVIRTDDGRLFLPDAKAFAESATAGALAQRAHRQRQQAQKELDAMNAAAEAAAKADEKPLPRKEWC